MEKRILFVDDDANVRQALERMLFPLQAEWELLFVGSGAEALALLEQTPCEVIVSDMRMPHMDGARLLAEVRQKHPHMIRLGLSGQSPQEMDLRAVASAHQYLAKPCAPDILKAALMRIRTLREVLTNSTLRELVSKMKMLPSLPSLFRELTEALQVPTVSLQDISRIIEKDIGIAAKLLQLVNSAFFGVRRRVDGLSRAISLLGLDTIKSLVLSVQIFSQCDQQILFQGNLHSLWNHSFVTGAYARLIARMEQQPQEVVDVAFTAGLLHDCGKLILATNLPEAYAAVANRARADQLPIQEAEREMFGVSHAEVGAYLLGIWGLPDSIIETIAFHYDPMRQEEFSFGPLAAVYLAEALSSEQKTRSARSDLSPLTCELLTRLGLNDRFPLWQQQCLAFSSSGSAQ